MSENGKSKYIWMPLLPGAFYAFVTLSYILNARIGLNLPWSFAYPTAGVFTLAYIVAVVMNSRKRRDAQLLHSTDH